mmetsp:Transcript_10034/g.21239  ORF Transcript_10034/g.21239 Transcript_10034/m.21239 type:complete len:383 (-) Transcript_10034:265-1413(-)
MLCNAHSRGRHGSWRRKRRFAGRPLKPVIRRKGEPQRRRLSEPLLLQLWATGSDGGVAVGELSNASAGFEAIRIGFLFLVLRRRREDPIRCLRALGLRVLRSRGLRCPEHGEGVQANLAHHTHPCIRHPLRHQRQWQALVGTTQVGLHPSSGPDEIIARLQALSQAQRSLPDPRNVEAQQTSLLLGEACSPGQELRLEHSHEARPCGVHADCSLYQEPLHLRLGHHLPGVRRTLGPASNHLCGGGEGLISQEFPQQRSVGDRMRHEGVHVLLKGVMLCEALQALRELVNLGAAHLPLQLLDLLLIALLLLENLELLHLLLHLGVAAREAALLAEERLHGLVIMANGVVQRRHQEPVQRVRRHLGLPEEIGCRFQLALAGGEV